MQASWFLRRQEYRFQKLKYKLDFLKTRYKSVYEMHALIYMDISFFLRLRWHGCNTCHSVADCLLKF
jgi:hypothetical protein